MGPLKSFLLTGFATIKPAGLIEKYKREKKSAHRHSFRMKRHQIGREFTFSLQFGGITGHFLLLDSPYPETERFEI